MSKTVAETAIRNITNIGCEKDKSGDRLVEKITMEEE